MAIRIRTVNGVRIALCAAETDEIKGDTYLDDSDHYALAAKFSLDWKGRRAGWPYEPEWSVMESQKLRDAETELNKWLSDTATDKQS